MENKTVLVTGAPGFIGGHLVESLLGVSDVNIRVLMRSTSTDRAPPIRPLSRVQSINGDLTQPQSLVHLCNDIDTVYHLAGYAHADDSDQARGQEHHQRITVEGTRALLKEAVVSRVRTFVFVSSVKALGEGGDAELNEDSDTLLISNYGKAKRDAEELVLNAGKKHGFHAVVLRLPLVYGCTNKGNIPRMIAAVDRGRFPPIPDVHNQRSMVHVEDVVRALLLVAADPRANGQRYIVTDGRNYSTRELYELICRGLGKSIPRWSVPIFLLRAAAILGDIATDVFKKPVAFRSATLEKLLGSARYSSEKIRRDLGFAPSRTFADGIAEIVEHYRRRQS